MMRNRIPFFGARSKIGARGGVVSQTARQYRRRRVRLLLLGGLTFAIAGLGILTAHAGQGPSQWCSDNIGNEQHVLNSPVTVNTEAGGPVGPQGWSWIVCASPTPWGDGSPAPTGGAVWFGSDQGTSGGNTWVLCGSDNNSTTVQFGCNNSLNTNLSNPTSPSANVTSSNGVHLQGIPVNAPPLGVGTDCNSGFVAVSIYGCANGEYIAVSGTGNATSRTVSVSGLGDASGGPLGNWVAVSGTGNASESIVALSGSGNSTSLLLAASGLGNASGGSNMLVGVAASGTGDAAGATLATSGTGCTGGNNPEAGIAVSGTNCAWGGLAGISGLGSSGGTVLSVGGSGCSYGQFVAVNPQGCANDQLLAISGTGSSNASGYDVAGLGQEWVGVAASGTNSANGDELVVSGTGCADGGDYGVAASLYGCGASGGVAMGLVGYSSGRWAAVSGAGDSSGYFGAISGTGNAGWGWAAVSGYGNASGEHSVSGAGQATGYSTAVSGISDSNSNVAAVSGTGSSSGALVAISGTGTAYGGSMLLISGGDGTVGVAGTVVDTFSQPILVTSVECAVTIELPVIPDSDLTLDDGDGPATEDVCEDGDPIWTTLIELDRAMGRSSGLGVGLEGPTLMGGCPQVPNGTGPWAIVEQFSDYRYCPIPLRRGTESWGWGHIEEKHDWNNFTRNLTQSALWYGWSVAQTGTARVFCLNYETPHRHVRRTWKLVIEYKNMKGIITAYWRAGWNNCP